MSTKEILEQFFKDQLSDTYEIFLYKDKQLLKEGNFGAFALEQLKKSKNMFWAMVSNIIIAIYYAIYFMIYFEELSVLYTNLFLGIFFGLISGAIIALIRDKKDHVFYFSEDVKKDLKRRQKILETHQLLFRLLTQVQSGLNRIARIFEIHK